MLNSLVSNTHVIILLRIVLCILLAFIPGIERELTGKFAGLRTHILVSLGACVFTILSIYGFDLNEVNGVISTQNDPARIAAQVITGIGFIGAGTVMRHGSSVSGITTAATLWVCAAIGMACGCGEYITAIIASIATLIILISVRRLEKTFLSAKKSAYVLYEVVITTSIEECETIQNLFTSNFHKTFKFTKKLLNSDKLKIQAIISTKKNLKDINETFKNIDSLTQIEISEYND